jgi:hypothetical protein
MHVGAIVTGGGSVGCGSQFALRVEAPPCLVSASVTDDVSEPETVVDDFAVTDMKCAGLRRIRKPIFE